MEKIELIEYVYQNKIDVDPYIAVFKKEQARAERISENFCDAYNTEYWVLQERLYSHTNI